MVNERGERKHVDTIILWKAEVSQSQKALFISRIIKPKRNERDDMQMSNFLCERIAEKKTDE